MRAGMHAELCEAVCLLYILRCSTVDVIANTVLSMVTRCVRRVDHGPVEKTSAWWPNSVRLADKQMRLVDPGHLGAPVKYSYARTVGCIDLAYCSARVLAACW